MKRIMTCYMYIVWCAPCIFRFGTKKKHRALLTTCERTIAPGGCVLVFYTHHRPHLAHRDMEFFKMAGEMRWECEKVLTERFPVRVPVVRAGIFSQFTQQAFYLYCRRRRCYLFSLCSRRTRARRRCGQRYMVGSSRGCDPRKIVHSWERLR